MQLYSRIQIYIYMLIPLSQVNLRLETIHCYTRRIYIDIYLFDSSMIIFVVANRQKRIRFYLIISFYLIIFRLIKNQPNQIQTSTRLLNLEIWLTP